MPSGEAAKATRCRKRSRLQHRAVLALLEHGTVTEAAEALSLSRVTLQRWTRRADFRADLRAAAAEVYGTAQARLRGLADRAVGTLAAGLDDKATTAQLRAAALVLEHADRAELADLAQRLERLEAGAGGDGNAADPA